MKFLKQSILAAGILTAGVAQAQSSDMTNMLKVRVNGGISTSKNATANVGVEVAYQHLVVPSFGLGVTTGYNHFFGKDNEINNVFTYKNNDFGVVPAALLARYYHAKTGFYLGADLGYGFIVGDDKVVENAFSADKPKGGFYLKPELGWHNKHWNIYGHFTKVFTGDKGDMPSQKYDVSSVGVGVGYNFGLGK